MLILNSLIFHCCRLELHILCDLPSFLSHFQNLCSCSRMIFQDTVYLLLTGFSQQRPTFNIKMAAVWNQRIMARNVKYNYKTLSFDFGMKYFVEDKSLIQLRRPSKSSKSDQVERQAHTSKPVLASLSCFFHHVLTGFRIRQNLSYLHLPLFLTYLLSGSSSRLPVVMVLSNLCRYHVSVCSWCILAQVLCAVQTISSL